MIRTCKALQYSLLAIVLLVLQFGVVKSQPITIPESNVTYEQKVEKIDTGLPKIRSTGYQFNLLPFGTFTTYKISTAGAIDCLWITNSDTISHFIEIGDGRTVACVTAGTKSIPFYASPAGGNSNVTNSATTSVTAFNSISDATTTDGSYITATTYIVTTTVSVNSNSLNSQISAVTVEYNFDPPYLLNNGGVLYCDDTTSVSAYCRYHLSGNNSK